MSTSQRYRGLSVSSNQKLGEGRERVPLSLPKEATLLAFQISGFQDREGINFCCVKPPN